MKVVNNYSFNGDEEIILDNNGMKGLTDKRRKYFEFPSTMAPVVPCLKFQGFLENDLSLISSCPSKLSVMVDTLWLSGQLGPEVVVIGSA